MSLRYGKPLHAPGLPAAGVIDAGVVQGDSPVRTDNPVEARFSTEFLLDQPFREGSSDLFSGGILLPEDGVGGHDGRCAPGASIQPEGTLREGTEMLRKVAAGEDGVFPVGEVAVAASFLGAVAVPMLGHGIDAFISPGTVDPFPFGTRLEPVAVGPGQVRGEVRIFAEGSIM